MGKYVMSRVGPSQSEPWFCFRKEAAVRGSSITASFAGCDCQSLKSKCTTSNIRQRGLRQEKWTVGVLRMTACRRDRENAPLAVVSTERWYARKCCRVDCRWPQPIMQNSTIKGLLPARAFKSNAVLQKNDQNIAFCSFGCTHIYGMKTIFHDSPRNEDDVSPAPMLRSTLCDYFNIECRSWATFLFHEPDWSVAIFFTEVPLTQKRLPILLAPRVDQKQQTCFSGWVFDDHAGHYL